MAFPLASTAPVTHTQPDLYPQVNPANLTTSCLCCGHRCPNAFPSHPGPSVSIRSSAASFLPGHSESPVHSTPIRPKSHSSELVCHLRYYRMTVTFLYASHTFFHRIQARFSNSIPIAGVGCRSNPLTSEAQHSDGDPVAGHSLLTSLSLPFSLAQALKRFHVPGCLLNQAGSGQVLFISVPTTQCHLYSKFLEVSINHR